MAQANVPCHDIIIMIADFALDVFYGVAELNLQTVAALPWMLDPYLDATADNQGELGLLFDVVV